MMTERRKYAIIGAVAFGVVLPVWYLLYANFSGIPFEIIFKTDVIYFMLTGVGEKPLAGKAVLSLLLIISPAVLFVFYKISESHRNRFGDARWARMSDINSYGYFGHKGIILGQTKFGRLLMSHGPKTVGLAARPRSGKGVGFVVPNLLNWPGSSVVIDVKKELFDLTSGFRAENGQKIICFDPLSTDEKSHCINIFDSIDRNDKGKLIGEVQKIAYGLMPDGKDKFWDAGGRMIFTGIALYLLETGRHCSIPAIVSFTEGSENLQDKMIDVLNDNEATRQMSDYAIGLLRDYSEMEPDNKLVPGYLATFNAHLEAFKSTAVKAATDSTTKGFDFSKLKTEKVTVYLVMRPEDMGLLGKLFGVICDRMVFSLTKGEIIQGETGRVMFMLDEFTALGPLERIKKGAAFLGGYGVRMCIIYQNHAQLETVYGVQGAKEITGLMHERIHFASSDIEEAKRVSSELGQRTVRAVSKSYSRATVNRSESEASKDLVTTAAMMRLPEHNEIILSAGQWPILCNKLYYYKDKRFMPRILDAYKDTPRLPIDQFIKQTPQRVAVDVDGYESGDDLKTDNSNDVEDEALEEIDDMEFEDDFEDDFE